MDQFGYIFNKQSIFKTLFFNIKTVTKYKSVNEFSSTEPQNYDVWYEMVEKRGYLDKMSLDVAYYTKACFLPEFSKIVSITYGNVYEENDEMKRSLTNLSEIEESEMLKRFFDVLEYFQNNKGLYICGHNINGYDIPFLIKRGMANGLEIPRVLKNSLAVKPWESKIIDTVNLWKFTGGDFISLSLISTFLDLKYTVLPMDVNLLSDLYWNNTKEGDNWIRRQSDNQVNLTIQLYRKLREM